MKTLVNKNNPAIRITAPSSEIKFVPEGKKFRSHWKIGGYILRADDWTLVEEESKHTEVWVEGRTIFEQEQKPAEWSEEDEHRRGDAIYFLETAKKHYADTSEIELTIDWLKSLRPQPHKEIYQAAKHDLAIKFMNYLDENSPEGRMCLSNGECKDIDKAFMENDWAKIIRYVKKYQIQSEQKSAEWNEDDSINIETLSSIIFDYAFYEDALNENQDLTGVYAELDNWLKSLPERFNLQPKNEWSEGDEDNLCRVIRVLEDNDSDWKELSNWLKSLKPQPKQDWIKEQTKK